MESNDNNNVRRISVFDTDELAKRIHAAKPKSVFLDAKSQKLGNKHAFGKNSKIGDQGLQSIKRAAFATETSDEVIKNLNFFKAKLALCAQINFVFFPQIYWQIQDIVYKSSLPVYRFLRVLGIFPYTRIEPGHAEFKMVSRIMAYSVSVFVVLLVKIII